MRRHLKIFVKNQLFDGQNIPDGTNARYFPTPKSIRNHMVHSKKKLRHSMIDQDCLNAKIEEWRTTDPTLKIFVRPKAATVHGDDKEEDRNGYDDGEEVEDEEEIRVTDYNSETLLFVYKSTWQQRLLSRYGNDLVLLDATYQTTRYVIPLFFMVVKTNIDYQIAATFVCESESTESIEEALNILKQWNPEFRPKNFMTDYFNEEMAATENVFKGCKTLICDFHREQAWGRWLRKTSNGCTTIKADALRMLRRIARSQTTEEAKQARWVQAYRQDRLLINCNTNNRTERQSESFKYQYLKKHSRTSLTGMLTLLTEEFFVDKYKKYCAGNLKLSSQYRLYSKDIPEFLKNRPRDMVEYCMKKLIFLKALMIPMSFNLEMKFPVWNWYALSPLYIESPFLRLDEVIVNTIDMPTEASSIQQHDDEVVDKSDLLDDRTLYTDEAIVDFTSEVIDSTKPGEEEIT
eukprot:gene2332-2685_t